MRVLLIYPTCKSEVIGSNPVALEESRGNSPPLGLLLLAGYLEANTDHEVLVLDAHAESLSLSQIEKRVEDIRPDVVGITAMTHILIDVVQIVSAVKKRVPAVPVVLGGPHVHLFPEESIRLPGVDYLVLGEGEITFAELLCHIDDRESQRKIPGIVFMEDGRVVTTGSPSFIEDLDGLPFPARHLTDINLYDSVLSPRHPTTTLFTSRGCPHVCSFCDRPHLGKRFRARSASNVVDEIEMCTELGIHEFLIYDDTFTIRRQRVLDVCDGIMKRGLDIGFDIRARVDTVDPSMLQKLAAAGCRGIHYGVESGTDKILWILKKKIDLATVRRVFRETQAAGMQVLAYFMIGCPTENAYDIRETFRMSRSLDPDFIHLTILTPFPGTELYNTGLEKGVFSSDVWREFARNPDPSFVPPHWGETFTIDELNEFLVDGYRGFYRRPEYLFKRVLAVRSRHELFTKTKAGLRILTMRSKGEHPTK